MKIQSMKNPDTEHRPIVFATNWVITITPTGDVVITINLTTGKKLVSTNRGACTPIGALREWESGVHSGYLRLPVMEDHTDSIIDVVFPPRSPYRN